MNDRLSPFGKPAEKSTEDDFATLQRSMTPVELEREGLLRQRFPSLAGKVDDLI